MLEEVKKKIREISWKSVLAVGGLVGVASILGCDITTGVLVRDPYPYSSSSRVYVSSPDSGSSLTIYEYYPGYRYPPVYVAPIFPTPHRPHHHPGYNPPGRPPIGHPGPRPQPGPVFPHPGRPPR